MESRNRTFKAMAALAALLLTIVLLQSKLGGSNFPRGLKFTPAYTAPNSYWQDYVALNPNQAFNTSHTWEAPSGSLSAYLQKVNSYGLKAILSRADWDPYFRQDATDSLPYLVEHYSWGQYNQLQVDWDYETALDILNDPTNGTAYYCWHIYEPAVVVQNWNQNQGLNVVKINNLAGTAIFLKGAYLTAQWPGESEIMEPIYNYPAKGPYKDFYPRIGRKFCFRFRAAYDTLGIPNVNHDDPLLKFVVVLKFGAQPPARTDTLICTMDSFPAQDSLLVFSTFDSLAPTPHDVSYYDTEWQFYSTGKARLYVDWVEYMDMEQGYPLFWNDSLREITLNSIGEECEALLDTSALYNDVIQGFNQSNEPFPVSYRAHGVVNDYFAANSALENYWPQTAFPVGGFRRPNHFKLQGRPHIFEMDNYPFCDSSVANVLGAQFELDTLVNRFEWAYQVCGDSIPLHFTGQVHCYMNDGVWYHRDPYPAEIRAESFIALAHGAKGLAFYKYPSSVNSDPDSILGLVNLNWQHPYNQLHMYGEKFDAVKDVFARLDSIGGILLSLDRVGAYLAKDANGNFAPSLSLDSVYFEEEPRDSAWIEVGQFQDAYNNEYLILVNRRTDADRHISVITSISGHCALRDIYTQERFVTSIGNFYAIPFDSGAGRVFKLEDFDDWTWDNADKIVLADTVWGGGLADPTINVSAGAVIHATKYGCVRPGVNQTLDCNGTSSDSVIFTALEAEQGWGGLKLDSRHESFPNAIDTLCYTRIEYASPEGAKLRNDRQLMMISSEIANSPSIGLDAWDCKIALKNSRITAVGNWGMFLSGVTGSVVNCEIVNNDGMGMYLINASTPGIGYCQIAENGSFGLRCSGDGTAPILLNSSGYPDFGHNSITDNGASGVFATPNASPELGRNAQKQGQNNIHGNVQEAHGWFDVCNYTTDTIFARYNWWGTSEPSDSQFYGLVDWAHYLLQEPDFFGGGSSFVKNDPGGVCGGGSGGPGSNNLAEAYRLNDVAVGLFLDGEYYAAIDTFALVLDEFPGTSPARFALDHIVVSYREAEDYAGAVAYLNAFLQSPPDSSLINLALYHKVLNLARLQEYTPAIAIAGNLQLVGTWPSNLLEPTLIELGMMLKYGLQNVVSGDSVFQQFLNQHPQSDLAPIAAMELGLPWEGSGIYGSKASGAAVVADLPEEFRLFQNHPNPFNPFTTITFGLPVASWVKVEVFDIAGRNVGADLKPAPTGGGFQCGEENGAAQII